MCYTAGEVKKMRTPEQVREILRALAQAYPAECSLQYQKDYELLFAVRLAAQCTDERVNQITPALFARFPTLEAFAAAEPEDGGTAVKPVNINTAGVSELDGLPGIGPVLAQRIVDWRTENGPFQTAEDLLQVEGISPATLENLQSCIITEEME